VAARSCSCGCPAGWRGLAMGGTVIYTPLGILCMDKH
jgi:hypothetical protein